MLIRKIKTFLGDWPEKNIKKKEENAVGEIFDQLWDKTKKMTLMNKLLTHNIIII